MELLAPHLNALPKLMTLQAVVERGFSFGTKADTFTNICLNHKHLWELRERRHHGRREREREAAAAASSSSGSSSAAVGPKECPCIDGDFVLTYVGQVCEETAAGMGGGGIRSRDLVDAVEVLCAVHA